MTDLAFLFLMPFGILTGLAFLMHGFPKLFTINIHKHYHYHGKEAGTDDRP